MIIFVGCSAAEVKTETQKTLEIKESAPSAETTPQSTEEAKESEEIKEVSYILPEGQVLKERFRLPDDFKRIESAEGSFEYFLQNLPLKPDGSKVLYYDGREKTRNTYCAVVDYPLGERDLQQCADAVMRLRAEYFYAKGEYENIAFNFVNGFKAEFSKWSNGYGISVSENSAEWYENSANNSSYESFQKYLDIVYAYSSTLSLEEELVPKDISEISIGDVFIIGGSPGHCVIVVDMAVNETGEKAFIIAQSYMPAQDIQILNGAEKNSPWYFDNFDGNFRTPEWTFELNQLRTWE